MFSGINGGSAVKLRSDLRSRVAGGAPIVALAAICVANLAEAKSLTVLNDKAIVSTSYRDTENDGGAASYRYQQGSSATANEATVCALTSLSGRLHFIGDAISSRQCGAKHDGATVDTVALQRMIDTKYPSILSAGTAVIDDELSFSDQDGWVLRGFGSLSQIRQKTAGKGIFKNSSGTRVFSILLEDFDVGVLGNIQGGTAILLNGVSDSEFKNVNVIADSSSQGMLVGWKLYSETATGGCYRNNFWDCDVRTAVSVSAIAVHLHGDNSAVGSSNSNKFIGGALRADSGRAFYSQKLAGAFAAGDQNLLSGVTFEGSSAIAVEFEGQTGGQTMQNVVTACRFEGVTSAVVFDSNAFGNVAAFNSYAAGVTSKVTDNSGRNWILEPYADSTLMRMRLNRGHFHGQTPNDTAMGVFIAALTSTGNYAFDARGSTDTFPRWFAKGSGRMGWGSGTAAEDVVLNRTSAKTVSVESGKLISAVRSFAASATTPDVGDGDKFKTANASPTTITNFLNSQSGHEFTILVDANTTIQNNANIKLAGGVNFVGTANDTIKLTNFDGVFYQTGGSVN